MPLLAIIAGLTGLLLTSAFAGDGGQLKIILAILLLGQGALVLARPRIAYLAFVLAFPLVPALPQRVGLPAFPFDEFLLLGLGFWWSMRELITRVRSPAAPATTRETQAPAAPVAAPFPLGVVAALARVAWTIAAIVGLYRYNLLGSDLFVLKLRDHLNLLQPWNHLDDLAPVRSLLTMGEGLLFFIVSAHALRDGATRVRAVRAIVIGAACVAALGIVQWAAGFQLPTLWVNDPIGFSRINATFADPNALGAFLAAALVLGLTGQPSIAPPRTWIPLALIVLGLVLSGSRSAWAAAGALMFALPSILHALRFPAARRWDVSSRQTGAAHWLARWGFAPVLALMALLLIVSASRTGGADAHGGEAGMLVQTLDPTVTLDAKLKGRLGVWDAAVQIFRADPVFGHGLGTFPRAVYEFKDSIQAFYWHENAHNYFLQLLAETGLVGFAAFVLLLTVVVGTGVRRLRDDSDRHDFLSTYAPLAALITLLIVSIAQHPLLVPKGQMVFWFLAALVLTAVPPAPAVPPVPVVGQSPRSAPSPRIHPGLVMAIAALGTLAAGAWQLATMGPGRHPFPYEYGFFDREAAPSGPYHWSGPRTTSLLPAHGDVLELELAQLDPRALTRGSPVDVLVDDRLVETVQFANTRWQRLRYHVPGHEGAPVVRVALRPVTTFVPSALAGGTDVRHLGIAVRGLTFDTTLGDEPIGVHDIEHQGDHGERAFRWTRGRASFPVAAPPGDTTASKLAIPLYLNNPLPDAGVDVELRWNGDARATVAVASDGWMEATLEVPPAAGVLTLVVSNTFNPQAAGISDDYRDLGVGVGTLRWVP